MSRHQIKGISISLLFVVLVGLPGIDVSRILAIATVLFLLLSFAYWGVWIALKDIESDPD